MAEQTAGLPFVLTGNGIWKGTNKNNGSLALIHNFHLSVGYSKLVIGAALQAELTTASKSGVPFGNALWYDRQNLATQPNVVYAGVPTAGSPQPKVAGILALDPALQSMNPADNGGVQTYNKGKIIKAGFVRYKTAKVGVGGAQIVFSAINDMTMFLFAENTTGDPIFAAQSSLSATTGKPLLTNATYIGKIVQIYPEDQSVLVQLDL
jgi:hypothetical protein